MSEDFVDSVVEDTSTPEADEVVNDQPDAEDETSESEDQTAEDDDEEAEQDDDQPDAESSSDAVDVEYDGKKYKLAPEIKDALMRTQDYTAKTQSLADVRQQHEAEVDDFRQYMESSQAHTEQLSELAAIDRSIKEFDGINWDMAFDQDVTNASKLQNQLRQLHAQREQSVGAIQEADTQRKGQHHEQMVRTASRTDAAMSKELPNWNNERKAAIGDFAVSKMGFPSKAVSNAVSEAEMRTLYYAEIGYNTVNKVKSGEKASAKKGDIQPSKSLKPKRQAAPKRLSAVSDPEQYRKMRLAQQQRKKA